MRHISTSVKKMIAGNITVNKLNQLVGLADIVDVSGALETNKVKDISKIKNFITEIKKINHAN
jgi:phosphoribosylanthranilate isomerase